VGYTLVRTPEWHRILGGTHRSRLLTGYRGQG
ncbi:uncharacterized protein METZ01_LOCUS169364, partial [marine metagenome]